MKIVILFMISILVSCSVAMRAGACDRSSANVGIVASEKGIEEEIEEKVLVLLALFGFDTANGKRFENLEYDCHIDLEWDQYDSLQIVVYRPPGTGYNSGELSTDNIKREAIRLFSDSELSGRVEIVLMITMH